MPITLPDPPAHHRASTSRQKVLQWGFVVVLLYVAWYTGIESQTDATALRRADHASSSGGVQVHDVDALQAARRTRGSKGASSAASKKASQPAVFVTRGIGITPVRGIIAQATHEKAQHRITLVYVNERPGQAAYDADFRQFAARNPRFTYAPVLAPALDAAALRRQADDLALARVYISGPIATVNALRAVALAAGADEDNLRTEEFEGY